MQLVCSNINYHYPGTDTAVLDDLTCSIDRPGFHSIFGPSGVGKSSFARLIADQSSHDFQGTVQFNGIETVLYSYNLERLPGWSSAGRHLNKVISTEKDALKKELIDIFNLAPLLDSRFHQLSMGQQNRMNLIRYLLQDFDLLILDESLANVDEKLRQKIILTIKQLFPEKMFLYISHNLMEVSTYCDNILVFGRGVEKKKYMKIQGQNYNSDASIERTKVDTTMLEIMNAF